MRHRTTYLAAVLIGAFMSAGASRLSRALVPNSAEAFWRCPAGYKFETSGTAVHCKRPAWTETKPVVNCAPGTADLKVDLVGTTDMCAADVEPVCTPDDVAAGFTKRRAVGRDFCVKSHRVDIIAPAEKVLM